MMSPLGHKNKLQVIQLYVIARYRVIQFSVYALYTNKTIYPEKKRCNSAL
jgi:hypothetical protein